MTSHNTDLAGKNNATTHHANLLLIHAINKCISITLMDYLLECVYSGYIMELIMGHVKESIMMYIFIFNNSSVNKICDSVHIIYI